MLLNEYLSESIMVKTAIMNDNCLSDVLDLTCTKIIEAYRNGNKILVCGNGGSAADAQHMAGELVSKFCFDRPGLSAIALSTDTSIITSIANDYSYDKIFERQVQALGSRGDILIALSTSGKSKNVLNAIAEAKRIGACTVLLTGAVFSQSVLPDILIKIPSTETPHIQEAHITILHYICMIVESQIFNNA